MAPQRSRNSSSRLISSPSAGRGAFNKRNTSRLRSCLRHSTSETEVACLLYPRPHCLPGNNARNLRANLKWRQGENFPNGRWNFSPLVRLHLGWGKKFAEGISIVLFLSEVKALDLLDVEHETFHYHTSTKPLVQSHGRLFHYEGSIPCRGLSSPLLWEHGYRWHDYAPPSSWSTVHSGMKLD